MRFDEHFLKEALPEAEIIHGQFPANATFAVDTRLLEKGGVFVALSGEKTDGHNFLVEAVAHGASGFIIDKEKRSFLDALDINILKKMLVVAVADPLQSLITLACAWRAHFDCPVVGVTGSVGKTSTKEMLSHVLSAHGVKHIASHGNQNTDIGLALNMLRMRPEHEVAVFEVGINRRAEMSKLARMIKPTTAIITAVGHAHMEGLGSLVDIAQEKRDIFKYFAEDNIGVINGDQPILADVGYVHPVVRFGYKTTNQIQARKVQIGGNGTSFVLKIYKKKYQVKLDNVHEGAILNVLAATAMAYLLGVPEDTIVRAIQEPIEVCSRFQKKQLKAHKGFLIDDCYNANPESMKASLLAFQRIETNAKKIAVLGDMLELGVNGQFWHRQLGRFLRKVPSLDHVILVGDLVKWTEKTLPIGVTSQVVSNWEEATKLLQDQLDGDSVVLVKASNGVGLGNLVNRVAQ